MDPRRRSFREFAIEAVPPVNHHRFRRRLHADTLSVFSVGGSLAEECG
jgi:hypothetical protein